MSKGSGSYCAVALCNNSSKKAKKYGRTDLSFHRFPKDPEVRKEWIEKCRRADPMNVNTSMICSDHFQLFDFITNYQEELLGYKQKRRLKPGAVPSRNIPYSCKIPDLPV